MYLHFAARDLPHIALLFGVREWSAKGQEKRKAGQGKDEKRWDREKTNKFMVTVLFIYS